MSGWKAGLGVTRYFLSFGRAGGKGSDIWKWTAKNVDIIAPDIYKYHPNSYRRYCEVYNREDNALFIPESSCAELPESAPNASNMFYAIGKYDAIVILPWS